MSTVGVERDEGKQLARRAVRRPGIGVFHHQCSATRGTRQRHGQRAHHGVGLLGVLVRDEELARSIDEYRMQFSLQGAAIGQAQIGAELGKYRRQGPVPPPLIDPHPALGYLPRAADPGIGERLLAQPVPCRTGYATQLPGLRRGHRNLQRSDAGNVDMQIPRRRGSASTERPAPARRTQQRRKPLPRTLYHPTTVSTPRTTTHGRVRLTHSPQHGVQPGPGTHPLTGLGNHPHEAVWSPPRGPDSSRAGTGQSLPDSGRLRKMPDGSGRSVEQDPTA